MYKRNRVPWTHEQLEELIPRLEKQLEDAEDEQDEEVHPLPPMNKEEVLEYLDRIMDYTAYRPLTKRERFTLQELHEALVQANMAEMLRLKGRYYVIAENDIVQLMELK